jgi:hypothetical protein
MSNRGTIRISDNFYITATSPLSTQIESFLAQGHNLVRTQEYRAQSFTLNHPDFIEPDGTEYMLVVTQDSLQRPYLYKLQAVTPTEFLTVRTYESPYV